MIVNRHDASMVFDFPTALRPLKQMTRVSAVGRSVRGGVLVGSLAETGGDPAVGRTPSRR